MRPILFRGQRVDNGQWVEGSFFEWNQGTYILRKKIEDDKVGLNYFNPVEVKPETVGQHLGFYLNAFEGDIIKPKTSNALFVITWNDLNKCFSALDMHQYKIICGDDELLKYNFLLNKSHISEPWLKQWDFEVIGNIHDNQEHTTSNGR